MITAHPKNKECSSSVGKAVSKNHRPQAGVFVSKNHRPNAFRLLLVVPLLFWSCSTTDFYNEYQPTGNEGWPRDSVLLFTVEAKDTLSVYDMYLQLRHSGRYRYQSIWMQVELTDPDSLLIARDTLGMHLADAEGNWLGAGSGVVFQLEKPYRMNSVFGRKGKYSFKISHCMNDTLLRGVTHAGLRISNPNGKE
jgi:gliding motility-associated lipoprotein GldH